MCGELWTARPCCTNVNLDFLIVLTVSHSAYLDVLSKLYLQVQQLDPLLDWPMQAGTGLQFLCLDLRICMKMSSAAWRMNNSGIVLMNLVILQYSLDRAVQRSSTQFKMQDPILHRAKHSKSSSETTFCQEGTQSQKRNTLFFLLKN